MNEIFKISNYCPHFDIVILFVVVFVAVGVVVIDVVVVVVVVVVVIFIIVIFVAIFVSVYIYVSGCIYFSIYFYAGCCRCRSSYGKKCTFITINIVASVSGTTFNAPQYVNFLVFYHWGW